MGEVTDTAKRVIENPISGERIVIRESGAQTGGRLLSFDLHLPTGAHVPAGHVHPSQEERFTVVTAAVDVSNLVHRKLAVLTAHLSQMDPANPFATMGAQLITAFGAEWFALARGAPGEGPPERSLFAGL
jgi:hypothetical protein